MHEERGDVVQTLVVLGATGNQGRAVLEHFAKHSFGFNLRGTTRNSQSKAAQELQRMGVDMVEAELEDLNSLCGAFTGATHIFATTDSNQNIFHAIQHPEVLEEGQTPRQFAREKELQQGKNIAEAASMTISLERLVWSSLPSPRKWSNGLYTKVTMFDTKEDILEIIKAKPELRHKTSALLIGFYATNALNVPELYGPQKQSNGEYELALPMSGDSPVPMADLQDMGKWVKALFEAPPDLTLVGSTETMSWKEWLQLWADRHSVVAKYRQAPPAEYESKIKGISDAVSEEFQFVERFGFTGGNSDALYPDQLRQSGVVIQRSTIKDHIARCDWSSIL